MGDRLDFLVPGGGVGGKLFARLIDELPAPESRENSDRCARDLQRVGRELGPYRLLELVGSGGMGAVYRARHTGQLTDRDVALKLLSDQRMDISARARFHQERGILARLSHPNIARIYDAGESDDGVLYYTMEFVDGLPITKSCRERCDSVEDRIRLLQEVVAALMHAHRNLIIHRDIKPSNVMVTAAGEVKLLDFGIAKPLSHDPSITHESAAGPMTPLYAAPEQFNGAALSVATDIYQLGVLMFQLLTGHRPYRADPHSPMAWSRAVIDTEPMPLTRGLDLALEAAERGADSMAWRKGADLRRVRHRLRGDLDAIVHKALSKDPDRRYPSADALDDDLRAFLEQRPVRARKGGRLYATSRFLTRNMAASIVAGLAVAVLSVGTWIGISTLRVERDLANSAAAAADSEARHAKLTRDFLLSLISHTDPTDPSRGRDFSVTDFLDQAARHVDTGLAEVPEARAEIKVAIANSLDRLEGPRRALPLLTEVIADLRKTDSASARKLLPDALASMAGQYNSVGDHLAAERAAREVLDLTASVPDQWKDVRIAALTAMARALNGRGKSKEALALRKDILAARLALAAPDAADVAMDHQNIAAAELTLDRFPEAETSYRKALTLLQRELGDGHPRTYYPLHGLGMALTKLGDYANARAALQQALAIARASLSADNPRIAGTLLALGNLALAEERFGDAERFLKEAESAAGVDDPGKFIPYVRLSRAELLLRTNRFAAAAQEGGISHTGLATIRGADNPVTLMAKAIAIYGSMRAGTHDQEAGERELWQLRTELARNTAPADEELMQLDRWLADVLQRRSANVEARKLRLRALAIARRIYGDSHPLVRASTAEAHAAATDLQ